jgi:cytochrome c556
MKPVRIRHAILIACAGLFAGAALAAEPEDIIKYRQSVMKANGGHMAATNAILQGKVDYKNQLGDHVKALVAINKDVAALFPKDSDFGDTKALDAVWQKRADFEKRAKDAQQKSAALAKAVAAGDSKSYTARFKELNDACKACHKDFRKEEK